MTGNSPPIRLHIDWTRCDGRGLCAELIPALLTRDEWGYPRVVDGSREPAVTDEMTATDGAAVARCPRLALTLPASGRRRGGRT